MMHTFTEYNDAWSSDDISVYSNWTTDLEHPHKPDLGVFGQPHTGMITYNSQQTWYSSEPNLSFHDIDYSIKQRHCCKCISIGKSYHILKGVRCVISIICMASALWTSNLPYNITAKCC